jgi:glycyl-tRNA synthetase
LSIGTAVTHLHLVFQATMTTNWQDELAALNAQVTKQGSEVRQLKKDGAEADLIAEAVQKLQELKIQVAEMETKHKSDADEIDRKAFDDLVLRKMFVIPSFEIHGGVKGLFDLGPPATALKVCRLILLFQITGCCCV